MNWPPRVPDRYRPPLAVLAATAVTLPFVVTAPAPSALAAPASTPTQRPSAVHQVTLLTGDVITFTEPAGGRPRFTVEPVKRPGNVPVMFTGEQFGTGYYVVPSDARPYLLEGSLDRELFNVRGLIREGLADASATTTPVIAVYRDKRTARRLAADTDALPATRRPRALPVIDGAAADVDRRDTAAFWRSLMPVLGQVRRREAARGRGVAKVWLDRRARVTLDQSVSMIGAPAAWKAGYDGKGVKVGVLDTGIDAGHPDLAGKVAASRNFTEEADTADGYGHGTHVASTIAGSGAASGGRYKGVAPGASLVVGKVCDSYGDCPTSAILAGMEWIASSGARVVNMSLGTGQGSDGTDPLSQAVNRLTAQTGVLFVTAAGNEYCATCVGGPGAATSALTVGAVDKSDRLADFSSRGPRLGDGAVKPEITGPGVSITAARAAGTTMGRPVDERYTTASGTSMATPHAAGAAALLAQSHPGWRAYALKALLISTAKDGSFTAFQQGSGRVDVARAMSQEVYANHATVDFGRTTSAGTKILTYTNTTAAPVTLTLALDLRSYSGGPATTGRLNTTTLIVPARGTAAAQLTVNPLAATPGEYGGVVTATSAVKTVSLRTPVSYYRPTPTVPVTVRVLGFDGKPPTGTGTAQLGNQNGYPDDPLTLPGVSAVSLNNGVGTARVPVGTYSAWGFHNNAASQRGAWLAATNVKADKAVDVTLDARRAVPAAVTTTEPIEQRFHQMVLAYNSPYGSWASFASAQGLTLYATPATAVDGPASLTLQDTWTLTRKDDTGSIYNLNYGQADGIPASLAHSADPAGLTATRTRYHADVAGLTLRHHWIGLREDSAGGMYRPTINLRAPSNVTEYVNPDPAVNWHRWMELLDAADNNYTLHNLNQPFVSTEDWYGGPVVPGLPGFDRVGGTPYDMFRPTSNITDGVGAHVLDVNTSEYPIKWRLFQGDTEIPAKSDGHSKVPVFPLPSAQGTYRLESTLTLPPTSKRGPSHALTTISPEVDTTWTFTSGKATGTGCAVKDVIPVCDQQPLLQIGYDLGLDPQNRAPAGQDHTVRLTPVQAKGAVGAGAVAGLELAYSTDTGRTWQDATVVQEPDGHFKATLTNPTLGEVWLRTQAWDDAGNHITQTVHRAYTVT